MSQTSILIERYERIALDEIRTLKRLHREIVVREKSNEDTESLRQQATHICDQLLSGLAQFLAVRGDMDPSTHDEFDTKIEPVRKLIQTTVNAINQLPPPMKGKSRNPFEDGDGTIEDDDDNIYVQEARKQMTAEPELKAKMEEVKMMADESVRLEQDIQDLNQIFEDLAALVHQQHDLVDSIEDNVEKSAQNIQRGNQQLKQAVKHNNAKVPVVAAIVGGLALGGPVGVTAGSVVAGVAAAVGGVFAGLYGGRYIKKTNTDAANAEQ